MQAKNELLQLKARLQKQIAVLQSEMVVVDKAIQLLERENHSETNGSQDKKFRKAGLSDACRQIVGDDWISPTEVRNELMQGGYPNDDKSKLLAAVFATLKRLGKKQMEGKKIDGKMKYRKRQLATVGTDAAA